MPTYYSGKAAHTLELRRGFRGKVNDPVMGEQDAVFKPLKLKFQEIPVPFPVFGLPSKDGLARGVLDPMIGASQIRRAANELGPGIDKLPKTDEELADWVDQRLSNHPRLGSDFVKVPDVEELVDGDAMDENLVPAGGVTSSVGVIVRDGTRAYCQVCERSLKPQGVNGHSRSKKHLEAMKAYDQRLRDRAVA